MDKDLKELADKLGLTDEQAVLQEDAFKEFIQEVKNYPQVPEPSVYELEMQLRDKIEASTDWRQKAAMAAKIISLNL